jgi:hypothetical protein
MLNYILQSLHDLEQEDKNIDAEAYYRLVLITRGIAVSRPQNLSNFEFTQNEGNANKFLSFTQNTILNYFLVNIS